MFERLCYFKTEIGLLSVLGRLECLNFVSLPLKSKPTGNDRKSFNKIADNFLKNKH